jgi:hypothetical protein
VKTVIVFVRILGRDNGCCIREDSRPGQRLLYSCGFSTVTTVVVFVRILHRDNDCCIPEDSRP